MAYKLIWSPASRDDLRDIVPEYDTTTIREIVVRSYRIVYRVNHDLEIIEIARLWHAARGTPKL